jgi:hypothetical protein
MYHKRTKVLQRVASVGLVVIKAGKAWKRLFGGSLGHQVEAV